MNKKLELKLQEKYPKIFQDLYGDIRTTGMGFGIECGNGWYWLIDNLCECIQSYIDNNPHLNIPQVIAEQVKEKLGGLRFYFRGGDQKTSGMIWLAELLSTEICEQCGSTKNIGQTSGWIITLCKDCSEKDEKTNWKQYQK